MSGTAAAAGWPVGKVVAGAAGDENGADEAAGA